ncbi:hypothetical protein [Streptomyces sp. NPDC054887]
MAEITPKLLERALTKACSSFAPDELAYLALSTRSATAWLGCCTPSCQDTSPRGSGVPTEPGGRTDLAVLDEASHEPLALLELKAAYTFDFARKQQATVEKYSRYMADDLAKASTVSAGRGQVYGLLLLTHPTSAPSQPTPVVKYGLDISRSLAQLRANDLSLTARQNARLILQAHGHVTDGTIRAGTAFGTDVDINYLLVSTDHESPSGPIG